VRKDASITLTLEVQDVPTGTLVMPLILIPTDGVPVWSVISQPTLSYFHILVLQSAATRPFLVYPSGTVYGAPGFVSSRYISVFNGVMTTTITNATTTTLYVRSNRLEPSSFA
jgi:hypothetical protein